MARRSEVESLPVAETAKPSNSIRQSVMRLLDTQLDGVARFLHAQIIPSTVAEGKLTKKVADILGELGIRAREGTLYTGRGPRRTRDLITKGLDEPVNHGIKAEVLLQDMTEGDKNKTVTASELEDAYFDRHSVRLASTPDEPEMGDVRFDLVNYLDTRAGQAGSTVWRIEKGGEIRYFGEPTPNETALNLGDHLVNLNKKLKTFIRIFLKQASAPPATRNGMVGNTAMPALIFTTPAGTTAKVIESIVKQVEEQTAHLTKKGDRVDTTTLIMGFLIDETPSPDSGAQVRKRANPGKEKSDA